MASHHCLSQLFFSKYLSTHPLLPRLRDSHFHPVIDPDSNCSDSEEFSFLHQTHYVAINNLFIHESKGKCLSSTPWYPACSAAAGKRQSPYKHPLNKEKIIQHMAIPASCWTWNSVRQGVDLGNDKSSLMRLRLRISLSKWFFQSSHVSDLAENSVSQ